MIKIDEKPIIGRVIENKYSSTIVITNYEKLPVRFLEFISKLAFVINSISYYPGLVCVISSDDLDSFMIELIRIVSYCKVESVRLI